MIKQKKIHAVKTLLRKKRLTFREIARRTRISRTTVAAIAKGLGPVRKTRVPQIEPLGPMVRCPGCGGRVRLPCLLCAARSDAQQPRRQSA